MTLAFLNPARSFDEVRNAVRFSGHDGMFEIRFFVEAAALGLSGDDMTEPEARSLSAFDDRRDMIHDAAHRAYSGRGGNFITLTAADFR